MKICSTCKVEKSVSEFGKRKVARDGLNSQCNSCRNKATILWRSKNKEHEKEYRIKNKESIKLRGEKYRENNKDKIKEYLERTKEHRLKQRAKHQAENSERLNKISRDYYKNNKEACSKRNEEYRENNKEKVAAWQKEYVANNKEKTDAYQKDYRDNNKEKLAYSNKEYRENNKEKLSKLAKESYKKHRSKRLDDAKSYYKNNKEKVLAYGKEYNIKNKDKINSSKRLWAKYKRKHDPLFKLKGNLSHRTNQAFKVKFWNKESKTKDMLGCSYEVAKNHLERQFTKGMNWSNHGKWHIDHIIPLASANNKKELYKLCHYTNLQPLWAIDNLSKHAKIVDGTQIPLRI